MKKDATIDNIRLVRHKISESVNHDPKKLVKHYQKLQERHKNRFSLKQTTEPESKVKNVEENKSVPFFSNL